MGQRLNIEIHNNGEPLANCYYHWSGYTECALDKIANLIISLGQKEGTIDVRKAVETFLENGATINKSQAQGLVEPSEQVDRNQGLIGTTKRYMENNRLWQEMGAVIDVGTKRVNMVDLFFEREPEEYDGDVSIDDLDMFLGDLESIEFDDVSYIQGMMAMDHAFVSDGIIQVGNDW